MKQTLNNTEYKQNRRGAFGRIAQPYSGAAPRGFTTVNLVRGHYFQKLAKAR